MVQRLYFTVLKMFEVFWKELQAETLDCLYFRYNFTSAFSSNICAERSLYSSQNPQVSLSVTFHSIFPIFLRVFFFTQGLIYSVFISIRVSIFIVSYFCNYHKFISHYHALFKWQFTSLVPLVSNCDLMTLSSWAIRYVWVSVVNDMSVDRS
jgi:hypothetical protein